MLTEDGEVELAVPRDRILSLYARGMTVREIQGHLQELYRVEVSPDLISPVTDAVLEEVRDWQNRSLDVVYPVVFFDALRVKIRNEGLVRNKAVYLALAITCQGEKEVLGLWIEQTEGAKFWLVVRRPTMIPRDHSSQRVGTLIGVQSARRSYPVDRTVPRRP